MTTLTDKEKKQAHAALIVAKLDELQAIVENESQAELWFGGLPSILNQVIGQVDHLQRQLREVFELPNPPTV